MTPNFTKVVQNLRPSLRLDLLLEKGLLLSEEYAYVRSSQHVTDEERSRVLLNEILRKKGPQSFELFCEVLLAVTGQDFLANDFLGYRRSGRAISMSDNSGIAIGTGSNVSVASNVGQMQAVGGATTLALQVQHHPQSSRAPVCAPEQPTSATEISRQNSLALPASEPLPVSVSDHLLYEVGIEIGKDWKNLAKSLGLTPQEIDNIKSKARSSRKRGWKMLGFWHSKVRGVLAAEKIHEILQRIQRMKETRQQERIEILDKISFSSLESSVDKTSAYSGPEPDPGLLKIVHQYAE